MTDNVKDAIKQLRDAIELAEQGRAEAASVFAYSASLILIKDVTDNATMDFKAPSKVMGMP